jgi:thiamine-monophosphate kinase
MTEFDIIRRYFTRPSADPDVLIGVGDDAAVLQADAPIAVAVDTLVSGIHFPERIAPDALGFRSLAVNLSDLAAMGARPRWCTLALTLPAVDEGWLEAFAGGLLDLASRFDVSLVGGDLTRGPLTVTVQVMGTVPAGQALTRGGGRIDDDIYVTGSLGDSAGGLAIIQKGDAKRSAGERALVDRFLRPSPRVEVGLALRGLASAAIDISDGLAADLGHLCASSGCGAVVDSERLPISAELLAAFPGEVAETYALSGGDDYELCFTAARAAAERVEAAAKACGTPVHRIGRLTEGRDMLWRRNGRPFTPTVRGYTHF